MPLRFGIVVPQIDHHLQVLNTLKVRGYLNWSIICRDSMPFRFNRTLIRASSTGTQCLSSSLEPQLEHHLQVINGFGVQYNVRVSSAGSH